MRRSSLAVYTTVVCFVLFFVISTAQCAILYVTPNGQGNGSSWGSAQKSVKDAANAASAGDEVWVAAGAYMESGISLKRGVGLYGGFSGNETERGQRDWKTNLTVLDGDKKGTVVMILSGADSSTVLDGFVIQNADTYNNGRTLVPGGGVVCGAGTPVIRNNLIKGNAGYNGGGVQCGSKCQALIENNIITGNTATVLGGGIVCIGQAAPVISGNRIEKNRSQVSGGGIASLGSTPTITGNTVTGNRALGYNSASPAGGGGIFINGASPIIEGNTITANIVETGNGGGVLCIATSARIHRNVISGNQLLYDDYSGKKYGGGAIACFANSAAEIASNVLASNTAFYGGGVFVDHSSPKVVNNTIIYGSALKDGGGVYLTNLSSPTIANNIIAFGSSGIFGSDGSPVFAHNCFYENDAYDYSGVREGEGDIHADPRLSNTLYGNIHLQPDSPCIDAGDDLAIIQGLTDFDEQARIQGQHVDIGADESDGSVSDITPRIVFVDRSASGPADGKSWETAYRTISGAVSDASATGGEVWVAKGVYYEHPVLAPFVHVYGGFAGVETSREQRDFRNNVSVIDGSSAVDEDVEGLVVGAGLSTIDGFLIRNGYYGIRCDGASTIISNNVITRVGYGIICRYSSSRIESNKISCVYSGGIDCYYGSPVITGNFVAGCESGVFYAGEHALISNNIIAGCAHGIDCYEGSGSVINNTVVFSDVTGINVYKGSMKAANNIVAFGKLGISVSQATAELSNNNIYGNRKDYQGVEAGTADISADPMLASLEFGNLHIQPGSPCVDAGNSSIADLPLLDHDKEARMQGSGVDIGADESDGTNRPVEARVVYVDGSVGKSGDGRSWGSAYTTLSEAIEDAAVNGGTEVWVAKGTYFTVSQQYYPIGSDTQISPFTHLYGGFAGNETVKELRDWTRNETVLEESNPTSRPGGEMMQLRACSTVDGFIFRLGFSGVTCYGGSPLITHNTFQDLQLYAVNCFSGSPVISNNVIRNGRYGVILNSDDSPVVAGNIIAGQSISGVRCYEGSPSVINNTIVSNKTGLDISYPWQARASNNIIAFNDTGVYAYRMKWDPPVAISLSHNDVFGNTTNYTNVAPGETDISVDPMFRDASSGDYHLRWDSPCIDIGLGDIAELPRLDIDGQGRVCWSAVDIGADEVWPVSIKIDIRPGEYPNYINTRSRGLVPVAILSAPGFDAASVDPASLQFAGAAVAARGNGPAVRMKDVDGDGDMDLVAQFESQNLRLENGAKKAVLYAGTYSGDALQGEDSVEVVR